MAIVGAGPSGLAASLALRSSGFSVYLLTKPIGDTVAIGEHLSPSARPDLTRLNLIDIVRSPIHLECPAVSSAWGSSEAETEDYLYSPFGHGWNLNRTNFDGEMKRRAVQSGVEEFPISRVDSVSRLGNVYNLEVSFIGEKKGALEVDFVIDATGRNAVIARKLGARRLTYDRLIGIVATAESVADDEFGSNLLIETQEDGWWYSAPLTESRTVTTFMTDSDLLADGRKYPPGERWLDRLERSRYTKDRIRISERIATQVKVRPAFTQTLSSVCGDGWLAVGDAAMALDPLSSQGISKALAAGVKAAQLVAGYFESTGSDQTSEALSEYATSVRQAFADYLLQHRKFYLSEPRWPDSVFWKRRHRYPS